jgi:hypothetical protein
MPINVHAIPNLGTFAYSHTTFHINKDCQSTSAPKQKHDTISISQNNFYVHPAVPINIRATI